MGFGSERVARMIMERLLAWLLPLIYYTRLAGWWLRRPVTLGVRMLVIDGDQILLVRGHGHRHWHLPGGAVNRYESLADAARREVYEETGCVVEVERLLGMYFNVREYKSDHAAIFVGRPLSGLAPRLNIEIAEARWFPLTALPPWLHPAVQRRLTDYASGTWGMHGPW